MIIRVRTSVAAVGQRGHIRGCRLREGIRRTRIGEEANDFQVWRRTDTGERVDARVDIVVGACTTSEDGIAVVVPAPPRRMVLPWSSTSTAKPADGAN